MDGKIKNEVERAQLFLFLCLNVKCPISKMGNYSIVIKENFSLTVAKINRIYQFLLRVASFEPFHINFFQF